MRGDEFKMNQSWGLGVPFHRTNTTRQSIRKPCMGMTRSVARGGPTKSPYLYGALSTGRPIDGQTSLNPINLNCVAAFVHR